MTTNEELTPQIAKEELPTIPGEKILSDEDLTQLFLMMLKHEFPNMSVFKDFINETATDMEIYGIIDNAEKVKTWVNAWCAKEEKEGYLSKPIAITAIKLAIGNNSPAAKRYLDAEAAEHAAIDDIMEEYKIHAAQAIKILLARNARKAVMMHGPNANKLTEIIRRMMDHLS